jgi:superfamily II DNA/RNA helicase
VEQGSLVVPFENHVAVLESLLLSHIATTPNFKIIVFFSTARVAGFLSELFTAAGLNILEMHSRKSQSYRTRVADEFRANGNTIMFSSDVSVCLRRCFFDCIVTELSCSLCRGLTGAWRGLPRHYARGADWVAHGQAAVHPPPRAHGPCRPGRLAPNSCVLLFCVCVCFR